MADLVAELNNSLVWAGAVLAAGILVDALFLGARPRAKAAFEGALFIGFTVILVKGGVRPNEPTPVTSDSLTLTLAGLLKICWWIGASRLLASFFRAVLVFRRQPRETIFLQDLLAGLAYVGAALGVITFVFDFPLSGLLAASGILAVLLGLALQNTLGDVFSGIVLDISKPYQAGDWILLDGTEGRVVEINWRATHILSSHNDLVIVPNSVVAKARVINASRPREIHGISVVVRVEPHFLPADACALIETAFLSCNKILRLPAPSVTLRSVDAAALEFELLAYVNRLENANAARNEMLDHVVRHCVTAGLRIAPPANSPIALPPRPPRRPNHSQMALDRLKIFAPLSEEEREVLAPKMRRRTFRPEEVLLETGQVASVLSILQTGVVMMRRDDGPGDPYEYRLAPGDCFGQSGLLTGAPSRFTIAALTDGVVYELDKSEFAPILKNRPAIATELGRLLAQREAAGESQLDADASPGRNLAERLAMRVKELFGLNDAHADWQAISSSRR